MNINELKRIIKLQPDNFEAHQEIVTRYIEGGFQQEAINILKIIIDNWPECVDAYHILSSIYLKRSDWSKAGQILLKITQLNPDGVRSWVLLAYIFDKLNNHKKAIQYSRQALKLKPEAEKALNILAFSLLKSGQHNEAKKVLKKLTALYPDTVDANYILSSFNTRNQPDRAPTEYVQGVFDNFADNFENHLVNILKYKVPDILNSLLRKHLPENSSLDIIDLGCGTGLMGERLSDISGHITGVDISCNMLDYARKKIFMMNLLIWIYFS